jgi:hypothetical protein
MSVSLSHSQALRLRLRAQRLVPRGREAVAGAAEIVRALCGVQAQEAAAAALSVWARSAWPVAADIESARTQERSVVRTWGMRGTLHLLTAEDLGWLLPLLGPIFVAGGRRRRAELGLDDETCAQGIRIIGQALASYGPLTRAELVEQLALHGLRIEGQARPHLLARAALEGHICLGPDRGAEPTYVLLADWIAYHPVRSPDAARAELARRYLDAYGPATPDDLATWSGLALGAARTSWERMADQLVEVEVAGQPAWMLKAHADRLDEALESSPVVRLLPRFDTYLLGYRSRDLVVAPEYARRINAGGGIVHPTLVVDGRALGTWKSARQGHGLEVLVQPFNMLAPEVYPALEAEVADLARFLGVQTALRVLTPPL